MIEVLRLGHRISRDKRISTHVCLVARTFGARRIYYAGQNDSSLEFSVNRIVNEFGGNFKVDYVKNYSDLVSKKREDGFKIVHLTMYGENLNSISKLKKENILFIIGGEKVPGEIYELADFNISIANQPHSEVAALAICLYDHFGKTILTKKFNNSKLEIIPQKKSKKIIER